MDTILKNVLSELNILRFPNCPPPVLEPLIKRFSDKKNGPNQSDILKVNKCFFSHLFKCTQYKYDIF